MHQAGDPPGLLWIEWRALAWEDGPPGAWGAQGLEPGLRWSRAVEMGLGRLCWQTWGWGQGQGKGKERPSDFDLRPEGLLDMLCMWVAPCPDGEASVLPESRGHRRGVHILRQLALVSEGVHDRAVSCQLLSPHLDVVVGGGDDDVFR